MYLTERNSILLGTNGIGKTNLINRIQLNRKDITIVATENHNLSLFRSVEDELFLINRERSELLEQLLSITSFNNKLPYHINSLSGGAKQILQTLLAVKYSKRIIIFDDNLEMVSNRLKEIIYRTLIQHKIRVLVTDIKIPPFYNLFEKFYLLKNDEHYIELDKKNLLNTINDEEIYIEKK